ncbi:hypothetical protein W822_10010 [Advenella kashmirensis W13003]|uniref:UPF0102 protein W822_10010 n=1 Tax=Advenella kashmirensis W13003 TaxID=1424334 RepID=V8QVV9_9BURK|nr:YraN family protein [Advenella kashmirensis]ETF03129.1 hypothetical protein W822_10010 [Advenella kashmirensis W13003]
MKKYLIAIIPDRAARPAYPRIPLEKTRHTMTMSHTSTITESRADEPTAFTLANAAQRKLQTRRRRRSGVSAHRRQASPPARRLSPSQVRGLQAEARAIEWLQARGLTLLATNLRCPYGELDAVFRADMDVMVIVEIRHRRKARHGGAAASITPAKQQRVRTTAAWHLPRLTALAFGGKTPRCRFDAVCIEGDTLNWLQAAF